MHQVTVVGSIVSSYALNPYSILSMPSSLMSDVGPAAQFGLVQYDSSCMLLWGAWADLRNRFRAVGRP